MNKGKSGWFKKCSSNVFNWCWNRSCNCNNEIDYKYVTPREKQNSALCKSITLLSLSTKVTSKYSSATPFAILQTFPTLVAVFKYITFPNVEFT